MSVSKLNDGKLELPPEPQETNRMEARVKALADLHLAFLSCEEEMVFMKEMGATLKNPSLISVERAEEVIAGVEDAKEGIETVIHSKKSEQIHKDLVWLQGEKKQLSRSVIRTLDEYIKALKKECETEVNMLNHLAELFTNWTAADWGKISEIFAEQNKPFAELFLVRHMVAVEAAHPDNLYFPNRPNLASRKEGNPLATPSIYANLTVNNLFLN